MARLPLAGKSNSCVFPKVSFEFSSDWCVQGRGAYVTLSSVLYNDQGR
jgi:hypothetical protein